MSAKLPSRQQRFADQYLVDGNGTRAYKAAGYRTKNDQVAASCASDLLRTPKVAAYIAKRQQKISNDLELDAKWVLQKLRENHDRAADAPVMFGGSVANKALELIGKQQGMFIDRRELSVTVTLADLLADASGGDK